MRSFWGWSAQTTISKKKKELIPQPPPVREPPREPAPIVPTPAPTVAHAAVASAPARDERVDDEGYLSAEEDDPDLLDSLEEGDAATFADKPRSVEVSSLSRDWPVFLQQLMDDRPHLGSFLSHASVASVHPHSVDLRYAQTFKFQFAEITRKQNRDIIEQKLAEFAGAPVQVHITLETTESTQGLPNYIKTVADTEASITDDLKNEPIIQAVLDVFDGEVID